jgi:hypothetical protein
MPIATIHGARDFIEVIVSAVSVLGGFMAFTSGMEASKAVFARRPPDELAYRINKGLASGFNLGLPAALIAYTLLA